MAVCFLVFINEMVFKEIKSFRRYDQRWPRQAIRRWKVQHRWLLIE